MSKLSGRLFRTTLRTGRVAAAGQGVIGKIRTTPFKRRRRWGSPTELIVQAEDGICQVDGPVIVGVMGIEADGGHGSWRRAPLDRSMLEDSPTKDGPEAGREPGIQALDVTVGQTRATVGEARRPDGAARAGPDRAPSGRHREDPDLGFRPGGDDSDRHHEGWSRPASWGDHRPR